MYSLIVTSLLTVSALATPFNIGRAEDPKVVCDSNSKQSLSFFVGPQKADVLTTACKNLQCPGEVCVETIDYTLNSNKTTTYPGTNVLEAGNKVGDKYSTWFTVHPPPTPGPVTTWTKDDCFKYFDKIATDCQGGDGIHPGSLTIQSNPQIKGAIVEITILPANETQHVDNH